MIFPNENKKRNAMPIMIVALALAAYMIVHGYIGASDHPNGATVTAAPTAAATVASSSGTAKTKVAYGAANYPALTSIDYGTYRKLDYQEEAGKNTYFYGFRNAWCAGASSENPENGPFSNQSGLYGVVASTNGDVLAYTAYTEIPNARVKYGKIYTYDQAKGIGITVADNKELTVKTTNLANGPYIVAIYFDYTANGKTTTIGVGRTLYVSNGNGYFAERTWLDSDAAMQSFLTGNRDDIAADDVFQAYAEKQGLEIINLPKV